MKRNHFVTLATLLIAGLTVIACGGAVPAQDSSSSVPAEESSAAAPAEETAAEESAQETAAEVAPAAGDITVGYVLIDLSHPFHLGQVEGAKEAARRHGFELKITSGEGDVNKQVQAFENLINEGVDVISVNFIDAAAFGPAMKKAEEAGIPVVCLHTQIEGCASVLGFDEWFTGRAVGEYAASLLQESDCWPNCQVANLQGLLGQGLNEARSGGFTEVMDKYPEIEVVAQEPTDWQPEKAVAAMENWLVAYPDLDLVYGNSDGLTVPAAETAQASGHDDILFVSVDGSDFAMEAIQNGGLKSTFLYAPEYTGYWKSWVPYRMAAGEQLSEEFLIKGLLINSDNVDSVFDLATDQKEKMSEFPFEETLLDIVDSYLGQSGESAEVAPAAGDITVGYVLIDLSHPFHLGQVEGAKEAARRHGFELKITSGEGDVNKQVQAFENLINEGVDVISVNFIDAAAFGPAMKKAEEAGIPVVCLHTQIEGCASVLGFDEWFTGRAVGEYAASLLQESDCWPNCQVANLQGLLGQGLNEARSGGFTEVMDKYPEIEVVAQEPTDWQPEKAVAAMENWLVAYPDLDLVYGNSDGLTVPAAETAQASGHDDILFVSVDGSDFAMEAIQNGGLKSTFLYAPEYTGYWKSWVPYRMAAGEQLSEEFLIKGLLINSDNVDSVFDLAIDQKEKISEFPFEETLLDIVDSYLQQ